MKKFLIVLMILSVLAGGFLVVRNDLAERSHNRVEIAVDMGDVDAMARKAVVSRSEMLERLQGLGATAVGLREATVARYRDEGSLAVIKGSELLNTWRTAGTVHPRLLTLLEQNNIKANAVYLVADDQEFASRLAEKARLKMQRPVKLYNHQAPYVVEIVDEYKNVEKLSIGLDKRDVQTAVSLGMRIVARPDNQFLETPEAVEETLNEFFTLPVDSLSAVVFEGENATGYPEELSVTADLLKKADVPYGIVEFNPRQKGVFTLADLTGNNVVLVHSNWAREDVHAIVNAAKERRVRLLYVRAEPTEPDFYEKGIALVSGVADELSAAGFVTGAAQPFKTPGQPSYLIVLLVAGVAAAAALLLSEALGKIIFPLWLVFAVAFLGLGSAFILLPANTALQGISILAAMIFSTLAVVTQQLNRLSNIKRDTWLALGWSVLTIIRTFILAIAGGLVVLGLTSNSYFTSGVPLFRGVKLVHTLPLIAVTLVAVMRLVYSQIKVWTLRQTVTVSRRILERPVLVAYMLLLGILAVAGYIYVGRTGHTAGIPVPDIEQQLRIILGESLLVRPRFKEFLIGYPLSMLGLVLALKGYRNVITAALLAMGAIATVSVVNTFMHFTTPGYITLLRSVNGLWLGLIFGILLTLCACVIYRFRERVAK